MHQHVTLCIAIEDQLQIGSHGQDLVHIVESAASQFDAHQREQAIEVGVVSEAQVCANAATGDSSLCLCLDTLPEGGGTTGGDALIGHHVAMDDGHVTVVTLVHGPHLLRGEDIVERHVEFHILHIRGDGV